jgi:serine/threonine protein kinase
MQSKTFGKAQGESFGDRYQIEQQLGKRAGRYTLLARDLQTQDLVVIKRLSFGEDFAWEDLKLFEREAATLKNLSHTSIPRYLDYFDLDLPSGKGFALVQTYIPAKSLEEHIKAGRTFSEAEMVELATALLEILRYLHERSPAVIHRDIKPSNILLGDRTGNSIGSVYLVDFGSVQAAPVGGTITVVGTYGYMPPEQFGDRAVPASDLYSLGATLIYLATGKHPADLPQIDQRLEFETLGYQLKAGQFVQQGFGPSVYEVYATAILARQSVS